MRVNLFAAVCPIVIACGGGSSDPPVVIVDDNAPADDPIVADVCPVTPNLGEGGLFLLDAGADMMVGTADDGPLPPNSCGADPCNFYEVPTMGPNMGKKTFFLLAGLPPTSDNDPATTEDNLLGIELVSNNGVFVLDTPVNFTTSASAIGGSVVFQMGTENYTAIAYVIGNVNSMGNFTHLYTSSSGSITPTQQGDTMNTIIEGSVAATNMIETDGAAAVAGGCTTVLDGLTYNLTQGANSFQASGGAAPSLPSLRARNIYNNILRKTGRL
jgi:hypothetical protein